MELDKPEFDPSFALGLNVSEEPGKSELSSLLFSYFVCKTKTNGSCQEDWGDIIGKIVVTEADTLSALLLLAINMLY